MTTKTKTTKTAADIDGVNEALRDRAVEVSNANAGTELELLRQFADAMTAGKLSVRGAKATMKAAADAGATFAELRESQAERFQTIAYLSQLSGAPAKIATLNTLADRMERNGKPKKGTSKAELARETARKAVEKKTAFPALDKRTPKQAAAKTPPKTPTAPSTPSANGARPDQGGGKGKGATDEPRTMLENVRDLTTWIGGASFDVLTADLQDALLKLADAIHDKLDDLA